MSHLIIYIFALALRPNPYISLFAAAATLHIHGYIRGERTTVRVGANLNICNQNNPHPSTQIIIMIVKWCRYTEQIYSWLYVCHGNNFYELYNRGRGFFFWDYIKTFTWHFKYFTESEVDFLNLLWYSPMITIQHHSAMLYGILRISFIIGMGGNWQKYMSI